MKKIFKAIKDKDFDLVRTLIENKEELVNCVAKQPPKKMMDNHLCRLH